MIIINDAAPHGSCPAMEPKPSKSSIVQKLLEQRKFRLASFGAAVKALLYWRFIVKVVLFIRSTNCPFYVPPSSLPWLFVDHEERRVNGSAVDRKEIEP